MLHSLLIKANELFQAKCLDRIRSRPKGRSDAQTPSLQTKSLIMCFIAVNLLGTDCFIYAALENHNILGEIPDEKGAYRRTSARFDDDGLSLFTGQRGE